MKYKHLLKAVSCGILGITLIVMTIGCTKNMIKSKYSQLKMNQISKLLNKSYLGELDNKKIEDSIYAGYISGLEDPFTRYLDEEAFKKQQVLEEGKYIGTGILFEWGLNGRYIIVTDIIPNSPAAVKKVKQGDKITEIDGIKVMLSNEGDLYKKLTYTGEEEVTYLVQENDGHQERNVNLKAEVIDIKSIDYELIEGNIGYIAISSIKDHISEELIKVVEELKLKGAQNFIIDIRNTYTNNVEEIHKLCTLFIDKQVIFKVKNKHGEVKEYKTSGALYEEPLTVIINGKTKGVLEAFAAAIQSSKRGKVVGEASAGLGLVTETIPLEDRTGLVISTGILYTSDNNSLKASGVKPDILIKNSLEGVIELITKGTLSQDNDLQLVEAIRAFY
ncbi:S41 family peptidase [Cellulosilyticum sp. I15G10I2]|uniref:S41 family peptidase n=1 Tax=Cellulosilyticum sp. I15G10I2 TaxID=1892843 RepID=UPI00085CB27F|nr:S41 family peptidase [Cellulosilyticum sp. I15G10I2]